MMNLADEKTRMAAVSGKWIPAPHPGNVPAGVNIDWLNGRVAKGSFLILTFEEKDGWYTIHRVTRTNHVNIGQCFTRDQFDELIAWYTHTTDIRWETVQRVIRKIGNDR